MGNRPPFIDRTFLLTLLTSIAALIAYILYRLGLGWFADFSDIARSIYFNVLSQQNITYLHTHHLELWFYTGLTFYASYHLINSVLTEQSGERVMSLLLAMFCLVGYVACFVGATTLWVSVIWGLPQQVSVEVFLQHQDRYYFYSVFWVILINIGISLYQGLTE